MVLTLTRWFAGRSSHKPARRTPRCRWAVTQLEDRTVPANVGFAVGAFSGPNTAMTVNVYDINGNKVASFVPFPNFINNGVLLPDGNVSGTVNVAVGDVTGDGTNDVIVGAGDGGGPIVRVFDGAALPAVTRPLYQLVPYDVNLRGGVNVAVGDVNADGRQDVITGAGNGGGPHVKAFSGMDNGATMLMSFMAYETSFRGGVRVAAADFGGDDGQNPNGTFRPGGAAGSHLGDAEILTAPGPGRPVDLELFDFNSQTVDPDHIGEIPAAQTFGTDFQSGGFVTGGFFTNNVDSQGFVYADVVVSADVNGGPQLKMYRLDSVADTTNNTGFVYLPANQVVSGDPAVVDPNYPLTSTFPFDITLRGGLRIGTIRNLSASPARDTLIVGPGLGGGPEVRLLNAQTGADVIPPFFAGDSSDRSGIFVG